ncbi:MAG: lamin tail domain-containing protein [Verrucomicrobiales bacterium]
MINEIHYAPPDNTVPLEFVELHNPGGVAVNLSGWRLEDAISFTFPAGASISAGGYVVVAENAAAYQAAYGVAPAGVFAGGLSSDGERVALRRADTVLADEVTYGVGFPWPTAARGTGSSMELIHPGLDNDLGGSWRSSGTPDNPVPQTVLIAPTDSGWRYRKGTSEASNPRTAWRQPGFVEDATWQTGRTSIGYSDDDDNTVLSDMMDTYWSVFLRKVFTVPAGPEPEALLLRVRVDDGCVVWINGQWVASFNTTTDDPLYNLAAVNHEGDVWQEKVITGAQAFLVNGANTIAILASNTTLNSSDFTIDAELKTTDPALTGAAPTPGRQNSVFAANAAPAVRQVEHQPVQPGSNIPVTVTAKVTDPQGVASVSLSYQAVSPGVYIRKSDAAYETTWTSVPMTDNGANGDAAAGDSVFTAVLPAPLQVHRRLVRYRITATDSGGRSVRTPYLDDEQSNFAYFVYDGAPAWTGRNQPPSSPATTFPAGLMTTLPTYHLIANESDISNSQYNSAYDTVRMWGTLVFDGTVYDHIEYHNKGSASTYQSGKNKWRFHFARARDFKARDTWGRRYDQAWDTFTMHACASPWNPVFRGWAGLDEVVSARVFDLAGVPAPSMHHLHFRVVDNAVEAPATQYNGDLWGLYLAVEDPDGSFLDERGLPDGNVYHIAGGNGDNRHQSPGLPADTSDWSAFSSGSQSRTSNTAANETWWRQNLDVPVYASFHAANRITGNVDLREGWNHYFYHRESDGRWLPIPWDLDMMYFPETHWSGTIDQKNCLLMSGISLDFKNRCRELLDLICEDGSASGGQIGQLVAEYKRVIRPGGYTVGWDLLDQYMWNYNPRTTGGHTGAFYLPNPVSDGRIGGTWTRTYTTPDFNGICDFLVAYATDTDPNSFAIGDGDQRGYGYNYLESEAADAAIPVRPTLAYVGSAGHPANDLRFQCSAFADAQGAGTFGAMQWRLARIAAPGLAGYVDGDPFTYEATETWTSGEVTVFANQTRIPTTAAQPGRTYRARVRFKDTTGRWSRWSPAVQFVAGVPDVSAFTASLVISEIMYHPPAATPAEFAAGFSDGDFEFIELRNVGATPLDLTDVRFTKGVDFDFPPGFTLAAGAVTLVVKNPAAIALRYGPGLSIAGSYAPDSLSNGGEQLKLSYGAGTAIRDFVYGTTDPWPAPADGAGYALVLKQPATLPDHALPTSWRAGSRLGGNPGAADSQTYASWAASYGVGSLTADPELDGLNNLMEYALAAHPLQASASAAPAGGSIILDVGAGPESFLTLSFRRPLDADDLTWNVQFSSALSGWSTNGILVSSSPMGDGTALELWRSPAPLTAQSRTFARLVVQ